MKNREKFAEQILDIACQGNSIALSKDGRIVACSQIKCKYCKFNYNDCHQGFSKWAESEYVEKPKISENDRRFLDYLPSEETWMARDKNGHLYLFCKYKPWKKTFAYWTNATDYCMWLNKLTNIDFPMVKWEDTEPWSIEDLKNLEVENDRFEK